MNEQRMNPRDELLMSAKLIDQVSQAIANGEQEIAFVNEERQELERQDLPTLLSHVSSRLRFLADRLWDVQR